MQKRISCVVWGEKAVLTVSIKLSYDNWLYYVIAYNIGIGLFVFMSKQEWKSKLLIKLGEIGFPFFFALTLYFQLCFDWGYVKKINTCRLLLV